MKIENTTNLAVRHHPKVFRKDGTLIRDYGEQTNLILNSGMDSLSTLSIAEHLSRMYVGTGSGVNYRRGVGSVVDINVTSFGNLFTAEDVGRDLRLGTGDLVKIIGYIAPDNVHIDTLLTVTNTPMCICHVEQTSLESPIGYTETFAGTDSSIAGCVLQKITATTYLVDSYATFRFIPTIEQVGLSITEIGISPSAYETYGLFSRLLLDESILLEEGTYLDNTVTISFVLSQSTSSVEVYNRAPNMETTSYSGQLQYIFDPTKIPIKYWSYTGSAWEIVDAEAPNFLLEPALVSPENSWIRIYGADSTEDLDSPSFEELGFPDMTDRTDYHIRGSHTNITTVLKLPNTLNDLRNTDYTMISTVHSTSKHTSDTDRFSCGMYHPAQNISGFFVGGVRSTSTISLQWGGSGYASKTGVYGSLLTTSKRGTVGNLNVNGSNYGYTVDPTQLTSHTKVPMTLFGGVDVSLSTPLEPDGTYKLNLIGFGDMSISSLEIFDEYDTTKKIMNLIPVKQGVPLRGVSTLPPYNGFYDEISGTYLEKVGGTYDFEYVGPTEAVPGIRGFMATDADLTKTNVSTSTVFNTFKTGDKIKEIVYGVGDTSMLRIRLDQPILVNSGSTCAIDIRNDCTKNSVAITVVTEYAVGDIEQFALHADLETQRIYTNGTHAVVTTASTPFLQGVKLGDNLASWSALTYSGYTGNTSFDRNILMLENTLFKTALYYTSSKMLLQCCTLSDTEITVVDTLELDVTIEDQKEEIKGLAFNPYLNRLYYTRRETNTVHYVECMENVFNIGVSGQISIPGTILNMTQDAVTQNLLVVYYDTTSFECKACILSPTLTLLTTWNSLIDTENIVVGSFIENVVHLWYKNTDLSKLYQLEFTEGALTESWSTEESFFPNEYCLSENGIQRVADGIYVGIGTGTNARMYTITYDGTVTSVGDLGLDRVLQICHSSPAYYNNNGMLIAHFVGSNKMVYRTPIAKYLRYNPIIINTFFSTGSIYSDGNSFLDTRISLSGVEDWVFEFTPYAVSGTTVGIGLVDASDNRLMLYQVDVSLNRYQVAYGSTPAEVITTDIPYNNRRMQIEKKADAIYIDGVFAGNIGTVVNSFSSNTIKLFGIENTSSEEVLIKTYDHIHGFKVWSDSTRTTLLHSLVPHANYLDNTVTHTSFKDLVTGNVIDYPKLIPGKYSLGWLYNAHVDSRVNTGIGAQASHDFNSIYRMVDYTKYNQINMTYGAWYPNNAQISIAGCYRGDKTWVWMFGVNFHYTSVAANLNVNNYNKTGNQIRVNTTLLGTVSETLPAGTPSYFIFPPYAGRGNVAHYAFTVWTDATRTECICNMLAVPKGSTAYSTTPAPSNCFYCTIRKIYIAPTAALPFSGVTMTLPPAPTLSYGNGNMRGETYDDDAFVTEWVIEDSSDVLYIPTEISGTYTYNATMNVYDSVGKLVTTRLIESYDSNNLSLTLPSGTYRVHITGQFPRFIPFYFDTNFGGTYKTCSQLRKIKQLGNVGMETLEGLAAHTAVTEINSGTCHFTTPMSLHYIAAGCHNLTYVNLSTLGVGATDLSYAFFEANNIAYLDITGCITPATTSMKYMLTGVPAGYDYCYTINQSARFGIRGWSIRGDASINSTNGNFRIYNYQASTHSRICTSNISVTSINIRQRVTLTVIDPDTRIVGERYETWPSLNTVGYKTIFHTLTGTNGLGFENRPDMNVDCILRDICSNLPNGAVDYRNTTLTLNNFVVGTPDASNVADATRAFTHTTLTEAEILDKLNVASLPGSEVFTN